MQQEVPAVRRPAHGRETAACRQLDHALRRRRVGQFAQREGFDGAGQLRAAGAGVDAHASQAQHRARELGNAAVSIQVDDELERAAPVNLSSLLQGRATGVQVLQSSGTVGTASTIKIRGNGTISLSNTPLIYIDGARVSNSVQSGPGVGGQTTSRLNDLTLEDIESVEIVKGPSASTLYGAEAAAGVIRITTKRGRSGVTEWTFRSEWGANWDDTDWPETVWNPRSFFDPLQDVSELFPPGQIPPGTNFATIPDTLY
ncbi:MAG: TonB-dependent receptor plug domain-containing protein, partial [Proteobacteria bacterium]|nr:TonB-dependent receptor plug domain-containing protein [Pseudomonadota bacterium]